MLSRLYLRPILSVEVLRALLVKKMDEVGAGCQINTVQQKVLLQIKVQSPFQQNLGEEKKKKKKAKYEASWLSYLSQAALRCQAGLCSCGNPEGISGWTLKNVP